MNLQKQLDGCTAQRYSKMAIKEDYPVQQAREGLSMDHIRTFKTSISLQN